MRGKVEESLKATFKEPLPFVPSLMLFQLEGSEPTGWRCQSDGHASIVDVDIIIYFEVDAEVWSNHLKLKFSRELQVKFCQNIEVEILSGSLCWGLIVPWAMFDYEMISQQCLTMPAKGYLFREPSCFNAFGYISCRWYSRLFHTPYGFINILQTKDGTQSENLCISIIHISASLVKTLAPIHTHMHNMKSCILMISLCLGIFPITLM